VSQADLTIGHSTTQTLGPAFSIPTKKFAMWLFIIADTMTFAACLVVYGFLRNGTPNWPRPFHSITNVAIMTFILLTSSLTMLIGLRSARAGDKGAAFRWTMITAALGIVFAFLHIREWLELIDHGMTLLKNPWEPGCSGHRFSASPACTSPTLHAASSRSSSSVCATKGAGTMRMTSRCWACTGISWIWFGCSSYRWSTF